MSDWDEVLVRMKSINETWRERNYQALLSALKESQDTVRKALALIDRKDERIEDQETLIHRQRIIICVLAITAMVATLGAIMGVS